jgi:hypothetical protein
MTKESEPGAVTGDLEPGLRYRDLHEWIAEARALGEIREVKGLSRRTDAGMAAEVLLRASGLASFVTGEDIRVDGRALATWGTRSQPNMAEADA